MFEIQAQLHARRRNHPSGKALPMSLAGIVVEVTGRPWFFRIHPRGLGANTEGRNWRQRGNGRTPGVWEGEGRYTPMFRTQNLIPADLGAGGPKALELPP